VTATLERARAEAAPANFRAGARPTWHQARRHAAVDRLVAPLTGGVALDYGCGWGDITARLAPRFDRIVGVDVSPDRVAFATSQYPSLEFRTCPTNGLDHPDRSYDVVLSIVVLPFVPSVADYLADCARVLRPGGHLVAMFPNPHPMMELVYRAFGRRYVRMRNLPTLASVREALATAGFAIEAETGFYDPPFDRITNPVELATAALNTVGHLAGIAARASYLGVRCTRT
jgi:ubiquinone/menaquinone biosynthesis C-methylase UbiE